MGRKRKYHTEEEKKVAQRRWQMEHYERNKEEYKAKARLRYRNKKRQEFYDKKMQDMYGNLE